MHVGRRDKQPQMLPGIPTSPKLKITVLMSLQNLCHVWICIILSESKVLQVHLQKLKTGKSLHYWVTLKVLLAAF